MATAVSDNAITSAPPRPLAGVWPGALDLAGLFAITWGLWFVLLHPNGVLKLYTPMYGFSLVVTLVSVLVAMGRTAEGWPLDPAAPRSPARGLLAAALAVGLSALVVHGLFWGFLGRFGVTYFSPQAIVAAGGVGAEYFNARENASTAIVYFGAAFLWLAVAVSVGLGPWPWESSPRGVRGFSRLATTTLLAVLAYAVLFHPHVTQLFFPAQVMAGVPPWWAELAHTGSAYFNLGWVMATTAVLVVSDLVWGGWPWRAAGEGGPWRGLFAFVGSLAAGGGLMGLGLAAMTAAWGEAFQGGQYTDAPYFRYLHAAEVAGFLVLATFALDTAFGAPRSLAGRIGRTALVLLGAALLHLFYYSALATRLLGKVQGVAQPEDTPLVWSLLFLAVVLVQRDLLAGWPLRRREPAA